MSMTARQCRALASIERQLRAREPRLASMFTIFSTLTKDELLPTVETIQAQPWHWLTEPIARLRRRRKRRHQRTTTRRRRFANAAFVPSVMLGLLVTGVVFGSHGSPSNRCGPVVGYHTVAVANAATRKCDSSQSQANR